MRIRFLGSSVVNTILRRRSVENGCSRLTYGVFEHEWGLVLDNTTTGLSLAASLTVHCLIRRTAVPGVFAHSAVRYSILTGLRLSFSTIG